MTDDLPVEHPDHESPEEDAMSLLWQEKDNLAGESRILRMRGDSHGADYAKRLADALTCMLDYVERLEMHVEQLENP